MEQFPSWIVHLRWKKLQRRRHERFAAQLFSVALETASG
jgi:hypothetical protein